MWKVHLEDLLMTGDIGYRMYVIHENHDGSADVMQPSPVMKRMEQHSFISHDQAWLDDSTAGLRYNVRGILQAMSDAAWEIGIRPRQIEDHASELKATKYHLEDMRKLVLK